jgi:HK97 family phage major capsid protein
MIGLQEVKQRLSNEAYKDTLREFNDHLEGGIFDYDERNIFGTGYDVNQTPIGSEDFTLIKESIKAIPLREFLAKSGTTGVGGAAYLIPTKIHQIMYDSAVGADITPEISIAIIPAEQIPGTTHKVDIAKDDSYVPTKFVSGGKLSTETIETVQATLDFTEGFGINFRITNDLIEDSQFDLIEMHIRNAGRELGEYAAEQAVSILATATDGDGTLNTEAGSDDETKMDDVIDAFIKNTRDGYVSDTYVLMHATWLHTIIKGATNYADYATAWHQAVISTLNPDAIKILDVRPVFMLPNSTLDPDGDDTECVSLLFDKDYALLTGRKRWLRIENYSDPVRDLVGATVTCRQDSVTLYDDAICKITEA